MVWIANCGDIVVSLTTITGYWNHLAILLQAVHDAVVRPVADKLAETKSRSVTLGLFLVLLVEKFDIVLEVSFIQFMCHSLLISPEMNNSTCADLDNITSHFPVNMANKRLSEQGKNLMFKQTDIF